MNGVKTSLSDKIIDEIALEGLEGITLSMLWTYLENSMQQTTSLPNLFKCKVWKFIQENGDKLQFYELPFERKSMPLYNRFETVDEEIGIPLGIDPSPLPRYKLVPIQKNGVIGSCENFDERKEISLQTIQDTSLEDAEKCYGDRLVVVASQELRNDAIFPRSVLAPKEMSVTHYCFLEIIARSRCNGEITSGGGSMHDYFKDATLVFYIKKNLVELGVITVQNYSEMRKDRFVHTTLLRLPRFYSAHRSLIITIIEGVFQALQENPNHTLPLSEIRDKFIKSDCKKGFHRISSSQEFRQIFEVKPVQLPSKNPKQKSNSVQDDEDTGTKKVKAPAGRTVTMVSLRNPNLTLSDIFAARNETAADETDENLKEYTSNLNKYAYVDMPIKDQFYNAIYCHGTRGISQSELCIVLGISNLITRPVVRNLVQEKLIKTYPLSVGRQKKTMFVANFFSENISAYTNAKENFKNLKCNNEPKPLPDANIEFKDNADYSASIKEFRYIEKQSRDIHSTQLSRMTIVINALNEKCLLHVHEVCNIILKEEKALDKPELACRKSIRRILNFLCDRGIINVYEATIKCESRGDVRVHRFITHPKIDINHSIIRHELLKLKNNLFVRVEELRLKSASQHQSELKKRKAEQKKQVDNKSKEQWKGEEFQKIPKFLVSRYMHEFLFYIIVELNESKQPLEITEELLTQWKENEPALQVKEYLDLIQNEDINIKAYTRDALSWRTFITPLKTYGEKPAGWVYLLDVMDRMPLSFFMKIFRLERKLHSDLETFLSHPIRQHYVLTQLPQELSSLINRVYIQRVIYTILKLLNNMGLIQVSRQDYKRDKLMMWAYFNRKAIIVDTTPSEIGYSKVNPDRHYESKRYIFESFGDVHNYWMNLQRICVFTKLGFRKNTDTDRERVRETNFLERVEFDEAPFKDIGYIPGDGLGAGGLSSTLFAHIFRNWSWTLLGSLKPTPPPVRSGRWVTQSSEIKNRVLKLRRANRMKSNLPISLLKRMTPVRNIRKRKLYLDATDREALKNMRTLRVSWSADEDKIFKFSRAVYMFISPPVLSLPLISMAKVCRDVIRHSLDVGNKTVRACLRRDKFLRKKNRLPEVPLWLNILQSNPEIEQKYGYNFLNNLKTVYPNREEYCDALLIHFVKLMCYLYKLINNLKISDGPKYCIPDTISEFQRLYSIKNDTVVTLYENPTNETDLKVSVAYSLLHSLICCIKDKSLYIPQAFELFKNYSEEILNMAFTKARKDGLAVRIKRRFMRMRLAPTQLAGPSYALSSKYRYSLMFLKVPYQIYEGVYTSFTKTLETLYGPTTSSLNSLRCYEFKSPNIGQLILTAEGKAKNFWSIDIKLPPNILIEDTEDAVSVQEDVSNYQNCPENLTQKDNLKELSDTTNEKKLHVKIQRPISIYKISYTPYDVISKLPSRKLHFFCALDHLHNNVEIDFTQLYRQEDDPDINVIRCPFKCILRNANYLHAIERIVHEKKSFLNQLVNGPAQKLNNPDAFVNSVKVQPQNLLGIVRMLDSFWHEKEESMEKKDLGKKAIASMSRPTVDLQKICQDILDFEDNDDDDIDKNDDGETTLLNKEDRLRDANLVSFPTIRLSQSEFLEADKLVEYNGLSIPQALLNTGGQQKEILDKILQDAVWTYTEETLTSVHSKMVEQQFSTMEQKHMEEIHDYIVNKQFGVSMQELLLEFPYRSFLNKALKFLRENLLVKNVGVSEDVYVHKKYLRHWLVQTFHITRLNQENLKSAAAIKKRSHTKDIEKPNKRLKLEEEVEASDTMEQTEKNEESDLPKQRNIIVMRPRPWIRLNGSLNRRVLDKWLGSILNECIAYYGISVMDLSQHFQYMYPADIHFLLKVLSDLKCICLVESKPLKFDLFADYVPTKESIVNEIFDLQNTYIRVEADAVTRMTNFIGLKKYNVDFI